MKNSICCSFCDSSDMSLIMDFGEMALAGGFVTADQFNKEKKYPMRLYFCESCSAVQIVDKINESDLFEDYFYFSSSIGTLSAHFKDHAKDLVKRFFPQPAESKVMEFGCNDGIFLRPLSEEGIGTLIGIDPAVNVVNQIEIPNVSIINDFFNENSAEYVVEKFGKMDMVLANNVYAHISDMQGITRAIDQVLDEDGVFIFEVHYLDKIINDMQYDMIYHEHIYYHSLLSLENHFKRYGMVIFDVTPLQIHAGSMRYYVRKDHKKASNPVKDSVNLLRNEEIKKGFDKFSTYSSFAEKIRQQKSVLNNCLNEIKNQGKTIAGYGASGRANTMIQFCGIDHNQIDYIIDDAPAKQGFYTPGSHFLIRSSEILDIDPPDYLLVFAWSFFEEISKKNKKYLQDGGKMITPLPEVRIVDHFDE